jgi:hypothetical protein
MRKNIGIENLGDLLDRPIVATLGTHRRDGSLLLSPCGTGDYGSGNYSTNPPLQMFGSGEFSE